MHSDFAAEIYKRSEKTMESEGGGEARQIEERRERIRKREKKLNAIKEENSLNVKGNDRKCELQVERFANESEFQSLKKCD